MFLSRPMASLTLHSDPFAEVGASSVKPLSQRVVRHALAIMHLLITEGDLVAEDTALRLSLDQRIQDKKIAIEQIMKLVLGILNLLNEGPTSLEQTVNLLDQDWEHVEREQREMYSDLLTENEQTLQNLGPFIVKTEPVLGMEREDVKGNDTSPSYVSASGQNGKSDPYTDSQADPSTSPVADPPSSPVADPPSSPEADSYHPHTFLNPMKDSSHSFSESADRTSVYGARSSTALSAFQRTCPNPCKDPYVTIFPDASSVSSYGEGYGSNSTEHFAENISNIQIKQEASPTDPQPQTSAENIYVIPETSYVEQALQVLCRKRGRPSKASNRKRAPKVSKPHDGTRAYLSSQDTTNHGQTLKLQHFTVMNKSDWRTYETNASADKPFPCLRCDKSFNCRSHLIMHNRVHTRERPYVCDCGKAFTQSSNLFRHQRGHRHHKLQVHEQSYPCPQCNKEFSDLSRLIIHQKTKHRVEAGLEGAVETYDFKIG